MTTRFKCNLCDCINDRRPPFKFGDESPRRQEEWNGGTVTLVEAKCVVKTCGHSSISHRFTFEKKDDN